MSRSPFLLAAIVTGTALGLAGCEVEKTADGDVTLPEYEVRQTQQGNVTLPEYDVDTPDVEVGTRDVQVTVPTVDVETPAEQRAEGERVD